jgi:tRNA pseudouridine38-40 synthase
MKRVALGLEYNGSELKGFQRQRSASNTVQAYLEEAISAIAQETLTLVCAGRTDAGVHATGQVVHFDTLADRPEKAWVLGVNTKLPDCIRVHWARSVQAQFHARFSAGSRCYRYILRSGATRSATLGKMITHIPYELDMKAMEAASQQLLGENDYSAFRSSQCQARNPHRNIEYIRWYRHGELVVMEIRANAFLHHMVRNIVGTLLEVGRGARDVDWVSEVLESKDRREAGATALPWGLYLVDVEYPEKFGLPAQAKGPIFLPE